MHRRPLWTFNVCGRLADIVEAATLLEELWDLTELDSSVGNKARLVFAARLLEALEQPSSQGEVPLACFGGVLVGDTGLTCSPGYVLHDKALPPGPRSIIFEDALWGYVFSLSLVCSPS